MINFLKCKPLDSMADEIIKLKWKYLNPNKILASILPRKSYVHPLSNWLNYLAPV